MSTPNAMPPRRDPMTILPSVRDDQIGSLFSRYGGLDLASYSNTEWRNDD